MLPRRTSGGVYREWLKIGSQNGTRLLGTIGLTNLLDLTSLAASGRLQNAIKYCTKVTKRVPPAKE